MLKYLPIAILLFSGIGMKAQNALPDFGEVTMEEMNLAACSFDKHASAMVLIDEQTTEVNQYKIRVKRRVRMKIFNREGYKYASIVIPFVSKDRVSKVTDITAYTFNLDGQNNIVRKKIGRSDIFRTKSDFDEGVSSVKFAFPDVNPGTVIEYRYDKVYNSVYYIEPWFFQTSIPVQRSLVTVTCPATYNLIHKTVGPLTVSTRSETFAGSLVRNTYEMTDIPAFRVEPFMSSTRDNLQRAEFSYTPRFGIFQIKASGELSWVLYIRELMNAPFFGAQLEKKIKGVERQLDSIRALPTDSGRINAVSQMVRHRMDWDHDRTFFSGPVDEAWEKKSGNSAEINFILINLLRRAGIKAFPVLASTKTNGRPDASFPNLGQFNAVDVLIVDNTGNKYLVDATEGNLSYQVPPLNILNRDVLIVDEVIGGWVLVEDNRPLLKTRLSAFADIDSAGMVKGEASISYFDLAKRQRLNAKVQSEEDSENEFSSDKDFFAFRIDSLNEEAVVDDTKPLVNKFTYHLELNQAGDFIFLDPFFLMNMQKNPFKDSTRISDIDFGANQLYSSNITYFLPPGMTLEHLPKHTMLRMADSSIIYFRKIVVQENMVLVQSSFEFQRAVFSREEYRDLSEFFEKVYKLNAEQIILRKP